MVEKITCKYCNKPPVIKKKIKYCGNLGCINYNNIVRRNYAYRQKRQKEKILIQEEE
jgi:Fe-S cluster biosynthesis and repair protein YggX